MPRVTNECLLEKININCSTSWFRPTRNNKYEWEDIKKIIKSDPLTYKTISLNQTEKIKNLIFNKYIAYPILIILFTISIFWKDLNIPSAIIAGLIAFHNATSQIIAKVRSENRQKWIDDVRSSLAELITYMHLYGVNTEGSLPVSSQVDEKMKAEKVRIKLELLMNPSEKDHRTIGYLLRKAYHVKKMSLIDKDIEENLSELLYEVIDMGTKENEVCKIKDNDRLISWLIRLSNATLKREWELVKNAK